MSDLDAIDHAILKALQSNARITNADLAAKVGYPRRPVRGGSTFSTAAASSSAITRVSHPRRSTTR